MKLTTNITKQKLMELAGIQEDKVSDAKQIVDRIPALFSDFRDNEDMNIAGLLDVFLIDNLFGGDDDAYESNGGYDLRDKMLENIIKATKDAVEKELRMIG